MTREWKYPPADGFTVHHVTDTHLEEPGRDTVRAEAIRRDMANLPQALTHARVLVHSGDLYHNMYADNSTALDWPVADQWLTDLHEHEPVPLVYSVGNHELWTHQDGDVVAQHFGMPARNFSVDYGPLRFIVYAADNDAEDGNGDGGGVVSDWVVPNSVLDWIEAEIDSTPDGMSAVIVSHCPPKEQFGYIKSFSLEPADRISAILSDHPKLVAWFTGHMHHWYDDANCFKPLDFGTHTVALIHGGVCGGTMPDSQKQPDHPVENGRINGSVYATYFGPETGNHRWEIRIRDHDTQTWGTQATGYQYLWSLPLRVPATVGELGCAATSAMTLDGVTTNVAAADFNGEASLQIDGHGTSTGEVDLVGVSTFQGQVAGNFTVITSYSYVVGN